MKNLIRLVLALMILTGYQSLVMAAPTHRPIAKADKAQRYTVGMSLTGCNPVLERVKLTLAGHALVSDDLSRLEGPGIQANDLRPGIYVATITLVGILIHDANYALVPTTEPIDGYSNDFINVQLGPSNLVKIISISGSSSPTVVSEMGGQTTTLVWKWGSNQDTSLFWKNAVAHNTIYHIGDTCKIVFYVGLNAASYVVRRPPPVSLSKFLPGEPFSSVLTSDFLLKTGMEKTKSGNGP